MGSGSHVVSPNVQGWKRGYARIRLGAIDEMEVAGAFSLSPVPAIAVAVCDKHPDLAPPNPGAGCWHGFSAHVSRLRALRYRPLDAALFEVALGGALMSPGGHWVGASQMVVAATFWPLCQWCPEPTQARGLAPDTDGRLSGALTPTCGVRDHPTALLDLDEFREATGIPAGWLSPDYVNWALSRLPASGSADAPRCACTAVTTLSVDGGLRHYFHELWAYDGDFLPDGSVPMKCRSCGQRWLYLRQSWPPTATKL